MADSEPSYIDYEAFLDPSFSPTAFANTLVTATNNASDTALDLSTPLSRVLFDVQEIDSHIHTLSTKAALPLLAHTAARTAAAQRIGHHVAAHLAALTDNYRRLEAEVVQRHATAADVHAAAVRLALTVTVGRAVGRCLLLARQLEAQMADLLPAPAAGPAPARKEDHRAMVRAASTLHSLRRLLAASQPGEEGEHLARVTVIATLQAELLAPAEQRLLARAQQAVREFSTSSLAPAGAATATTTVTYAQTEETKARTTSACLALCFLSPPPPPSLLGDDGSTDFQPALLLTALQTYLQTALTASLAALARALGTLPTLPRTLLEVAARCQNIVALEALLAMIKPPGALLGARTAGGGSVSTGNNTTGNLLQPLLAALDTASLPSFFWRSLASGLAGRVQEIVGRGGVSARTLRSQRERVRESIRECVVRGSQGARGGQGGWEREVGVMVGSVLGPLGR